MNRNASCGPGARSVGLPRTTQPQRFALEHTGTPSLSSYGTHSSVNGGRPLYNGGVSRPLPSVMPLAPTRIPAGSYSRGQVPNTNYYSTSSNVSAGDWNGPRSNTDYNDSFALAQPAQRYDYGSAQRYDYGSELYHGAGSTTAAVPPPPAALSLAPRFQVPGAPPTAAERPPSRTALGGGERSQQLKAELLPQRASAQQESSLPLANMAPPRATAAGSLPPPPSSVGRLITSITPTPPPSRCVAPPSAPHGLRNIGNTCYMNASLQCLLHSTGGEFIGLLSDLIDQGGNAGGGGASSSSRSSGIYDRRSSLTRGGGSLAESLVRLSQGHTNELFQVKSFAASQNREFYGSAQNDSHEFIRELLHTLHKEINRVRTKPKYVEMKDIEGESDDDAKRRWAAYHRSADDSIVYDLFGGMLRSVTKCEQCNFRSLSFDPVLDLSVPLSSSSVALDDCIRDSAAINQVSEYRCAKCASRNKSGARNQMCLQHFPRLLVIHLKRFSALGRKNTTPVTFGTTLAVPWMSQHTVGGNDHIALRYELSGVVCHMGSSYGGHYIAYVRPSTLKSGSADARGGGGADHGNWYECDDSTVTKVAEAKVLSATSAAYVLFYQLLPTHGRST